MSLRDKDLQEARMIANTLRDNIESGIRHHTIKVEQDIIENMKDTLRNHIEKHGSSDEVVSTCRRGIGLIPIAYVGRYQDQIKPMKGYNIETSTAAMVNGDLKIWIAEGAAGSASCWTRRGYDWICSDTLRVAEKPYVRRVQEILPNEDDPACAAFEKVEHLGVCVSDEEADQRRDIRRKLFVYTKMLRKDGDHIWIKEPNKIIVSGILKFYAFNPGARYCCTVTEKSSSNNLLTLYQKRENEYCVISKQEVPSNYVEDVEWASPSEFVLSYEKYYRHGFVQDGTIIPICPVTDEPTLKDLALKKLLRCKFAYNQKHSTVFIHNPLAIVVRHYAIHNLKKVKFSIDVSCAPATIVTSSASSSGSSKQQENTTAVTSTVYSDNNEQQEDRQIMSGDACINTDNATPEIVVNEIDKEKNQTFLSLLNMTLDKIPEINYIPQHCLWLWDLMKKQ